MLKWRSRFASKSFLHKQLLLDLAGVQKPTRWTVALIPGHKHISMIPYLWRSDKRLLRHRHSIFPIFLYVNRHEPHFKRLSDCAGSNENKSFLRPDVHAILNVCWWKQWPRMSLSHDMSHDDLALWVHARHHCSLPQRPFFDDLHGPSSTIEFIKPVFPLLIESFFWMPFERRLDSNRIEQ